MAVDRPSTRLGAGPVRIALTRLVVAAVTALPLIAACSAGAPGLPSQQTGTKPFHLVEASIDDIHAAYRSGQLTARKLVELYLARIDAYDKKGPALNAIITINPKALEEADRLDKAFASTGPVGALHGIPIVLKDQVDAAGMPTTLGSVLFEDYQPSADAFVTQKLKNAGAIILAKTTLGELGGGDTHGSLFGSTRNPYALDRTVGGSSGGSGASVAANFATAGIGQEANASIRRPSGWNSIVGMRPTEGLVSRSGVYDGWPQVFGSLGPMARSVADVARVLDAMVGYDAEDPVTALGVGHAPKTYTAMLDRDGLRDARIGVLRESIGLQSEPGSEDFAKVTAVFDRALGELKGLGATLVDPIVIPGLKESLAKRASSPSDVEESWKLYFARGANAPFKSRAEMLRSPEFAKVIQIAKNRFAAPLDPERHYQYVTARDALMVSVMKVMADNRLDAIVHKTVEHQPTLIKDGVNPPFVSQKGVPNLNTFLVYVPVITVPAGLTSDNLPAGITFMGRPYEDGTLIRLAYAYEQAGQHRKPPMTTPALPGEP
jgi:Asp-tRNA(Asn)/Glu-tRNA(Gln) amidotransferase A subunit family amidase